MQIYLAPMEGITGYVVRNAFARYFGGIDKYFTPFIPAAKRMNYKILRDLSPDNNQGIFLVPQLISNRSDEVLDMIRQLEDLGFSEFNINLGCPSGTVVSKKRGSGLLSCPDELDRFLEEIYKGTSNPVSLKTRIGFQDPGEWPRILAVYEKYPVSELIIHPRIRKEFYNGFVHLDAFEAAFQDYKAAGRLNRLCYNGDLWDTQCWQQVHEQFPELETFMIGRGLLARPDLAGSIKGIAAADTRKNLRSFCEEIYEGYRSIFKGEKDAVGHMKEIWSNLGRSFQDSGRLVKKILKCQSPEEYRHLTDQIFDTLELSPR